ncbi:copper/zinc superoxide dismutase [Cokeromyces recurvatus]|uniref:copper/zinc superoxide dismutase n=1 Tax=Cokeromyces recurvatus TaxID=90255 RepID=UPI00221E54E5|nr:copper/zinc superoxide dismutase [Cokeromyces recurvatus]KAI7906901.1 copper/zinc superoxide dismutase [Cokeromyces recurvatus]
MRFTALAILASALVATACNTSIKAIAYLNDTSVGVSGSVTFIQHKHNGPTEVIANISGLPQGDHGIHVHQYGDLSDGCTSLGAHYNPFNKTHGGPTGKNRHVGDFGNIVANAEGQAMLNLNISTLRLSGPHSIIGRGIVIHTGKDDLGLGGTPLSNTTGNSGARLACAVIGYAST